MSVPAELRYTTDHEWVRPEGDVVRIGITDYAQDALGDVVYVQLPEVGATVVAAGTFGEVESTKSVSDLFAPISGVVVAVNDALVESPQLLNDDPYGDGWVCTIRPADLSQVDALMDADAYRTLVG
jgi:glycine cleavage system H protein